MLVPELPTLLLRIKHRISPWPSGMQEVPFQLNKLHGHGLILLRA